MHVHPNADRLSHKNSGVQRICSILLNTHKSNSNLYTYRLLGKLLSPASNIHNSSLWLLNRVAVKRSPGQNIPSRPIYHKRFQIQFIYHEADILLLILNAFLLFVVAKLGLTSFTQQHKGHSTAQGWSSFSKFICPHVGDTSFVCSATTYGFYQHQM